MEKKELFSKLRIGGAMAIFGTIGIFVKYLTLPSGFLVFLRAAIGFLFLLPFVIFRKKQGHHIEHQKQSCPSYSVRNLPWGELGASF